MSMSCLRAIINMKINRNKDCTESNDAAMRIGCRCSLRSKPQLSFRESYAVLRGELSRKHRGVCSPVPYRPIEASPVPPRTSGSSDTPFGNDAQICTRSEHSAPKPKSGHQRYGWRVLGEQHSRIPTRTRQPTAVMKMQSQLAREKCPTEHTTRSIQIARMSQESRRMTLLAPSTSNLTQNNHYRKSDFQGGANVSLGKA